MKIAYLKEGDCNKQVMDLTSISRELADATEDADLVVLEGMVSSSISVSFCCILPAQ
jgi:hypothetical protein